MESGQGGRGSAWPLPSSYVVISQPYLGDGAVRVCSLLHIIEDPRELTCAECSVRGLAHPHGEPWALTHHPGVVIIRQHALTEGHQQPEGLLLAAIEQEHRGDNVHGLQAQRQQRGDSLSWAAA